MSLLRDKHVEVLPLTLALLPLIAVIMMLGHSEPHFEASAEVVRSVAPGSTEPGTYRPVVEAPAAPEPMPGAEEGTGAWDDDAATAPEADSDDAAEGATAAESPETIAPSPVATEGTGTAAEPGTGESAADPPAPEISTED